MEEFLTQYSVLELISFLNSTLRKKYFCSVTFSAIQEIQSMMDRLKGTRIVYLLSLTMP